MQEKILARLKNNQGFVSGEEISGSLKISRQALWKHIQDLKDAGYDIIAVPHLGYRLASSPDRLYPYELRYGLDTGYIGKNILYLESVASTMDAALQAGIDGASEGTAVVAEAQTKGRGRLGRQWSSPKYKGIYMSLILRPDLPPLYTPVLTLLVAVGVCRAIKEVAGLDAKIKWPNDIFLNNKKLGGILTELNAEMDITRFVVAGLGLNVNNDGKSLPPGATSLYEHSGAHVSRAELLREIFRKIEEDYGRLQRSGSADVIDQWRAYSTTLGRRVRIVSSQQHLEGEAVDVDLDGALLLRLDSGVHTKITSGDIVHCR
ncbi:MAG: biotin--[acetyl-CoA-carboxylase] ligase [Candidatus Omnitrophica bacterium]|nr:biotin--[acetyl-CoA-carboxylase] ligase [Candidatus Omnitrophota bacterium]